MKVSYRVWLDQHGKVFGEGPFRLLKRVGRTASLHQAASDMGMSYSKAWRLIQTLEERLGFKLLDRRIGGQSGGGSNLTPEAEGLVRQYERFRRDVKTAIEKIYLRHFGRTFPPAKRPHSRP